MNAVHQHPPCSARDLAEQAGFRAAWDCVSDLLDAKGGTPRQCITIAQKAIESLRTTDNPDSAAVGFARGLDCFDDESDESAAVNIINRVALGMFVALDLEQQP